MSVKFLSTYTSSLYLQKILHSINDARDASPESNKTNEEIISAYRQNVTASSYADPMDPRKRRRLNKLRKHKESVKNKTEFNSSENEKNKLIASFVPDEVIYDHKNYNTKSYKAALLFADVSGFTKLCEAYTKTGKDGTSRLTQVLNQFIGNMVFEILTHGGDLLKFSGDAFLAMWKSSSTFSIGEAVHAAIDCGLTIQRDYGIFETDVGITLKVKVAISGGNLLFSLIGNAENSHYLVVGQPVWDAKHAEAMSKAGDVIVSPSGWKYVNTAQYIFKSMESDAHKLVLGTNTIWRNIEKLNAYFDMNVSENEENNSDEKNSLSLDDYIKNLVWSHNEKKFNKIRQSTNCAVMKNMKTALRKFILVPVVNAIEKQVPMEYLIEMRNVVIIFLNIILYKVSDELLVKVTNDAYIEVCKSVGKKKGLVNKVSLFDKDMMFLIVFGLREMKHDKETQDALICAFELRKKLIRLNHVSNVSIGVTSGLAYCGVVGHILRKEYTVIGLCVNKAARLMVNYPDKVTCDDKTYLQSKLHMNCFKVMPFKPLKGIEHIGLIYEFNADQLRSKPKIANYALVNRLSEIEICNNWLKSLTETNESSTTIYKAAFIIGDVMIGKSRLLNVVETLIPKTLTFIKISLQNNEKFVKYFLIKNIITKLFENFVSGKINIDNLSFRDVFGEVTSLSKLCFLHEVFHVDISEYSEMKMSEGFKETSVFHTITKLFSKLKNPVVVAVDGCENIDSHSWKILPALISKHPIAIITTVEEIDNRINELVNHPSTLKINVGSLNGFYTSALICSILNVKAISNEMENIIRTYSNGVPGWVEKFLIMVHQVGDISIRKMDSTEASLAGFVIPYQCYTENNEGENNSPFMQANSEKQEKISIAELKNPETYSSLLKELNHDVHFLQIYDSLMPYEQLVLKCCSTLGRTFNRIILIHTISATSNLQIATAIKTLFETEFFECAGGDFTKNDGHIFVHTSSRDKHVPMTCNCIGINEIANMESNLPKYAWCGFIKFKNESILTSAYDLLTENQKKNFHLRAISFLEANIKQCNSCGSTPFNSILGKRQDIVQNEDTKMKSYILSLGENTFESDLKSPSSSKQTTRKFRSNHSFTSLWKTAEERANYSSYIRNFDDVDYGSCECFDILNAMYIQMIHHCKQAAQIHKLYETYLEYILFNIEIENSNAAIALLTEVEAFVKNPKLILPKNHKRFQKWRMNFLLGRIYSLRGLALFKMNKRVNAEHCLEEAMEMLGCHFSFEQNNNLFNSLRNLKKKVEFNLLSAILPKSCTDIEKAFLNQISETLSFIYRVLKTEKQYKLAYNVAKWSLKYALIANDNFPILSTAYANYIEAGMLTNKSNTRKVILSAMKLCSLKEGVDRIEIEYIIRLYNSIFYFESWQCNIDKAVKIGNTMRSLLSHKQCKNRFMCLMEMSSLLVQTKQFTECVSIFDEMKSLIYNDLSYKMWYFIKATDVHLDTGYTVEPYENINNFFKTQETVSPKNEISEAYWTLAVNLWLRSTRLSMQDSCDQNFEEITQNIMSKQSNIRVLTKIWFLEGILINVLDSIKTKNLKTFEYFNKIAKEILKDLKVACNTKILQSRYYLMKAYHRFIIHNDGKVIKYLESGIMSAITVGDLVTQDIFINNDKAWHNRLTTENRNVWKKFASRGREMNISKIKYNIAPFVFPVYEN